MQEEILSIAREIYLAAGTEKSRLLLSLLDKKDFSGLVSVKTKPEEYTDAYSYYVDVFCTSFLSKYRDFPGQQKERDAVALTKWLEAEKQCFRTNSRFDRLSWDYSEFLSLPVPVQKFLDGMKKDIQSRLGKVPESFLGRHGPGTTLQHRGAPTVLDKFSTVPEATRNGSIWIQDWVHTLWCDAVSNGENKPFSVAIVKADRLTFVPKKATESRCISVGPTLNVYYQLGVGNHIRGRLNREGLLLSESQSTHRSLAKDGSLTGLISTIDLSSASDTIAYNLVKFLLPQEWFSILDSLRVEFTEVEGKNHRLEKFSAMGNGYTFELETLIFSSACRVMASLRNINLSPENFSVYGDDIIVPSDLAHDVIGALRFLGFKINADKSFIAGPFRESCGGDFFSGIPVRGVYVSKEPKCAFDWMQLANQLRPHVDRYPGLSKVWGIVVNKIPKSFRHFGPHTLGSTVIHTEDPARWKIRVRNSVREIRSLRPVPIELPIERWDEWSRLVALLSGHLVAPNSLGAPFVVSRRDHISGYREAWTPLS